MSDDILHQCWFVRGLIWRRKLERRRNILVFGHERVVGACRIVPGIVEVHALRGPVGKVYRYLHVLPNASRGLIHDGAPGGLHVDVAAWLMRERRSPGTGAVAAFARARSARPDSAGCNFCGRARARAVAAHGNVDDDGFAVVVRAYGGPRRCDALDVMILRGIAGIHDVRFDVCFRDDLGMHDRLRSWLWLRRRFRAMFDAYEFRNRDNFRRGLRNRLRVPRHQTRENLVNSDGCRERDDEPAAMIFEER